MNWCEITIKTTVNGTDIVAEILYETDITGVVVEDGIFTPGADDDYIDESVIQETRFDEATVKAYLQEDETLLDRLAFINDRLAALSKMDIGVDLGSLKVSTNTVQETDWSENWKKYYKPFKAGKHIVVKPTWEEYKPELEDIVIELDPGMAFGTGTHETTKMCIEYIEEFIKPGDTAIDVGCGSGILSIVAAKLGAGHVTAVDRDPVSVKTARENIALNVCEGVIEAYASDLLQQVKPQNAALVVANIIADIIIRLNESVHKYLKQGGIYIVSGIIASREEEVKTSLLSSRFEIIGIKEMGEWRAIACKST